MRDNVCATKRDCAGVLLQSFDQVSAGVSRGVDGLSIRRTGL